MKKTNIQVVHDDDLEIFLKDLDLWNAYKKGELHCSFCGEKISDENLYSILPKDNLINFCCNKKDCISKIKNI